MTETENHEFIAEPFAEVADDWRCVECGVVRDKHWRSPVQVARDVMNGLVEEHETKWWRGRATTLAYEVMRFHDALPLGSIENPLPVFDDDQRCPACNGNGLVSDMDPFGGEKTYECPDCKSHGVRPLDTETLAIATGCYSFDVNPIQFAPGTPEGNKE